MQSFFAILKDSFREAVDGFVIYVMLGLSSVVILVVASMSFMPAEPGPALEAIVQRFSLTFPDKGRSRVISASFENRYAATEVKPEGDGYRLRLKVTANGSRANEPDKPPQGDSFRRTVAAWLKQPGRTVKMSDLAGKQQQSGPGGSGSPPPEIEFSLNQEATLDEQRAVTNADMEEFLRHQFAIHAGLTATVQRLPADEPQYEFDVTTSGGSAVRGWPHTMKMFFGTVTVSEDVNLGTVLWIIEDQIINGVGGAVALLIGLIITAFFIPNMLRKGSIDLLLCKPIGRAQLLIYKYIGGLTFVFLITSFTVGGIWLAIGLRSGHWDLRFLAVIPLLTFTFAIVYAVSTLVAVVTRSPIAAMIVSIGFMLFLYIVGQVKTIFDRLRLEERSDTMPAWVFTLVDALNNWLPRYKDLDKLTSKLIADGTLTEAERRTFGLASIEYPSWESTIAVTLAFIALMLALACVRMVRRDY
ncbi:MAG: ABC transporter permease [Gemmataceae bacterium]|nr:ABC transporter permease [Gemmata sp.]MDW8198287.1 ABC transporter permease [Gemmataceae bacterium]